MMIKIENLVKKYGSVEALKGISFNVAQGEIIGFLGPNGAGKTTTMKIITGFMAATSGSATIAGYDITEQSLQVRQSIGYLPENAPIYSDMNVVDYLRFIADVRGLSPAQFREYGQRVIQQTGLAPVLSRTVGVLSKGFRQRVGLAQAMIHNPKILILDEPTNGLDPNQIVEIRELIKKVGQEKTVILCSHILSEVTATCTRVIIITDGRLVAEGTPAELSRTQAKGTKVTAVIRGPASQVEAALGRQPGVTAVRQLGEAGAGLGRYEVRAGEGKEDFAEQIFKTVAQNQWSLAELKSEGATLEEVFKQLTTTGEDN